MRGLEVGWGSVDGKVLLLGAALVALLWLAYAIHRAGKVIDRAPCAACNDGKAFTYINPDRCPRCGRRG